ncbi:MAG: regulatory protein RecX [Gammaproteobacteria bacterium]|nr:regulatory protein RecX [Gammaproteobacteria bacterium]
MNSTGAGATGQADPRAVQVAAAALLARRDHPSGELRARLLEQGFDAGAVDVLLAEFAAQRIVDDARYAERYVAVHAARGRGSARLRRELAALGIAVPLIESAIQGGPDWVSLARLLRTRKFGSRPPQSWAEKTRQARFLQYRGFSVDHIRSALGADDLDPDS